jgi:PST family polysaccharide transporter
MAHDSKTQSLTDRTLAGLLWMFSGAVGQGIVQMVVVIVLARLLTPFEFGVVGAAGVVISFSRIFSMFGVGPSIVQARKLTPRSIEVGFTLSLLTSLGVATLVYASAPLFAAFFKLPELLDVMRALSFLFPIQGLSAIAQARLERDLRFKALAFVNASTYAIGYGGVGVIAAALGAGVWALVLGQLAHAIAATVVLLVLVPGSVALGFEKREARRLLGFGTGFSLSLVGNHVAVQADNLVVGRWLGAEALGVYGRAYQLVVTPASLVGGVIDRVLFPAMASVQKEQARMATGFSRASAVISLVTLPTSAFLIAAAPEIVFVLLGPQWNDVVMPFRILAAALAFRTGYKLSDTIVNARGAVYEAAWRKWVYAATVAWGAWIGQTWGLGGVATGVGVAILIHYFVMLGLSLRLAGLPWKAFFRIQAPYWAIAPISFIGAWIVADQVRAIDLHPAALIAVVLAASVLPSLVVLRLIGDRMGAECAWVVATARGLATSVPRRLDRPR